MYATGVGGTRISYEIRGRDGDPTAVLIQGLGLSSRFWFDLPERLASGSEPWRVVTIDNRGVGRSDRPLGGYTMATMADDVARVVDRARIERAHIVGISLGGMIAQHVALRHGSRVAGLVLLATSAGYPHMERTSARTLARFLALPLAGDLRREELSPAFARMLLARRDVADAARLLTGWADALRSEPTSLRVYAAQFAALLTHSTGRHLGRITCPTVIVAGDDDALMPLKNSQILARRIKGAHLEVVSGGHIVDACDRDVVRRALERTRALAGEDAEHEMSSDPPHVAAGRVA